MLRFRARPMGERGISQRGLLRFRARPMGEREVLQGGLLRLSRPPNGGGRGFLAAAFRPFSWGREGMGANVPSPGSMSLWF